MVDLCSFLVGASPTRVAAWQLGRDPELEDSSVLVLSYPDGSVATVQYLANTSPDLPKERFEVSADGHTARCDNFKQSELPGGRSHKTLNQDKGQATAVKEVVEAVRRGAASPFTVEALRVTSRVTLCAAEAAATGRSISLDD